MKGGDGRGGGGEERKRDGGDGFINELASERAGDTFPGVLLLRMERSPRVYMSKIRSIVQVFKTRFQLI